MAPKAISIPYVGPQVEALLLWKNPVNSGAVLGGVIATYTFFALSTLNPLVLVLRLLAFGSLVTLAWHTGATTFGRAGPTVPPILVDGVKEADVSPVLDKLLPHVNKALSFLGVLASGKNVALSLKFVAVSYVASLVIAALPPFTLAFVVVLLAFTLPKVYELKQDEIDKLVAKAMEELKKVYAKVDETVLKKLPGATPKKQQ